MGGAPEGPVATDEVPVVGLRGGPRWDERAAGHCVGISEKLLRNRWWQELVDGGDEHAVAHDPTGGRVDASECFHDVERLVRCHFRASEGLGDPHSQHTTVDQRRHDLRRQPSVRLTCGGVLSDQRLQLADGLQQDSCHVASPILVSHPMAVPWTQGQQSFSSQAAAMSTSCVVRTACHSQSMHGLFLINLTWWVNRPAASGSS